MTITAIDPAAVAAYVARCEPYLADLGAAQQRQLRDDIAQIVEEVSGELQGTPDDLVGTPERFVTELRAAAGMPRQPIDTTAPASAASAAGPLAVLLGRVRAEALPWSIQLRRELRPAWWVARGFFATIGLGILTSTIEQAAGHGSLPYPHVFGSAVAGTMALVAVVIASVNAGRASLGGRRRVIWALIGAASVVVAGATLIADRSPGGAADIGAAYADPVYPLSSPATTVVASTGGFEPVVIDSSITGESQVVLTLADAIDHLTQLHGSGFPPASIRIVAAGEALQFSSLDEALDYVRSLADQGMLATP